MPIEHGGGGLNAFALTLVKKHLGFASLALAEIAWRPQNILIACEGDGTNHSLDPNNDDYYDHEIEHCPDIKDSVFLTPTSSNPYSPFEVLCLPKDKWEVTNKKLEGNPEGCFYSRNDVNVEWKDGIGIFKD